MMMTRFGDGMGEPPPLPSAQEAFDGLLAVIAEVAKGRAGVPIRAVDLFEHPGVLALGRSHAWLRAAVQNLGEEGQYVEASPRGGWVTTAAIAQVSR